jgi:rod shape-determining protein MreD
MIRNNLRYILLFVLSVLIQTLLFDRVYFTGYINVFVYILFILLLPAETNKSLVMFLGFMIGFSVDIANSTPGLHAAATVLLCFVRPFFLRIYSPRDGYDSNKFPSIKNNGLVWFLKVCFKS